MIKINHWFCNINLIPPPPFNKVGGISFPKQISLIVIVAVLGITIPVSAQITDPLGNRVFDKSGKELYKIEEGKSMYSFYKKFQSL